MPLRAVDDRCLQADVRGSLLGVADSDGRGIAAGRLDQQFVAIKHSQPNADRQVAADRLTFADFEVAGRPAVAVDDAAR